ncbi:hypothetical protein [Metabacillus malikii]|uniref:Uncharacterized protein n=1 Tax=Metabacillus malikii TaxID=1504265 RepID=A0ABT9ZQ12_9BACI|nr:hypothetical protein [Metabacillus malikii]MDQ0233330.1 hypothetical protein [Metabacillus malikii]
MKWLIAIILILIGSLLYALTIDNLGNLGHIIIKIIGIACFFLAGYIVRSKKKNDKIKKAIDK